MLYVLMCAYVVIICMVFVLQVMVDCLECMEPGACAREFTKRKLTPSQLFCRLTLTMARAQHDTAYLEDHWIETNSLMCFFLSFPHTFYTLTIVVFFLWQRAIKRNMFKSWDQNVISNKSKGQNVNS